MTEINGRTLSETEEKILRIVLDGIPDFALLTDSGKWFIDVDEVKTAVDVYRLLRLRFGAKSLIYYGKQLGYSFEAEFWDMPRSTEHECMFAFMNPKLQPQVSFGTGKGGVRKYHCKRFVADFYDSDSKTVIEIDGNSHLNEWEKKRDKSEMDFFLKNTLSRQFDLPTSK